MIPLRIIESYSSYGSYSAFSSIWVCLKCPHSPRQSQRFPEWYSLMIHYKDKWYEINQTFGTVSGPRLLINRIEISERRDESNFPTYHISSHQVLQRNMDANLTPWNVDERFPNLLVFS